jgi:hypothetical protein
VLPGPQLPAALAGIAEGSQAERAPLADRRQNPLHGRVMVDRIDEDAETGVPGATVGPVGRRRSIIVDHAFSLPKIAPQYAAPGNRPPPPEASQP